MGRKFSSGAFICSSNEMRMHYTWIAGDINFLPWTCSGPRAESGGRAVPGCAGVAERKGLWVAVHPVYNIHWWPGGERGAGTHHRSGHHRGGGKVERRVAIPRAVSCSHVQPRASFLPDFLPTFASPGDFDEWSDEMYRPRRGGQKKNSGENLAGVNGERV